LDSPGHLEGQCLWVEMRGGSVKGGSCTSQPRGARVGESQKGRRGKGVKPLREPILKKTEKKKSIVQWRKI